LLLLLLLLFLGLGLKEGPEVPGFVRAREDVHDEEELRFAADEEDRFLTRPKPRTECRVMVIAEMVSTGWMRVEGYFGVEAPGF
jgi:hypothetical protein